MSARVTAVLLALALVAGCSINKDRGTGNPNNPGNGGKRDLGLDDLGDADLGGDDLAMTTGDLPAGDLLKSSDLKSGDLAGTTSNDLAGPSSGGAPLVGQCITDDDCGGETCNPYFPGGRCLSCLSCPSGSTCNPNAGVCTQDCTDCGDTLVCGTVGGEAICNNPSCSGPSDCPAIYECRILEGGGASSTKYCQRRKCTGTSDTSCPTGTDCRQYAGSTYVCVETALF